MSLDFGLDDEIILLDLANEFEEYGIDEEYIRECFERNGRRLCETYFELTSEISNISELGPYRTGPNLECVVNPPLMQGSTVGKDGEPGAMTSLAEKTHNERLEIEKKLLIPEESTEKNKLCWKRTIDFHGVTQLGARQIIIRLAADLRPGMNYHITFITGTATDRDHDAKLPNLVKLLCQEIWGIEPEEETGRGKYHIHLWNYTPRL